MLCLRLSVPFQETTNEFSVGFSFVVRRRKLRATRHLRICALGPTAHVAGSEPQTRALCSSNRPACLYSRVPGTSVPNGLTLRCGPKNRSRVRGHRHCHTSYELLERLNKEVKRRADVVGIFPNEGSIIRLIGAVLLEANGEWQTENRYMQTDPIAELVATGGKPEIIRFATVAA
nr:transposase [Aurantimonas coralicida]